MLTSSSGIHCTQIHLLWRRHHFRSSKKETISVSEALCRYNFFLLLLKSILSVVRLLCSAVHFLFLSQPESTDKMDASVDALASVTDGLIIKTHRSAHSKPQHLIC